MFYRFVKHFLFFLLLCEYTAAKNRERILCVAGNNAQYYFRRPEGLDNIRACNIIHGNIFIVMMELSFEFVPLSNLTELIGSLNFYANDKITSLSELFPNLSVIRADNPGTDSPFMVKPLLYLSWNVQLERINLTRLTYMEGPISVLSDELCYYTTINWDKIAHYRNPCPQRIPANHHCWESCPKNCKNCWSEDTCQLECNCSSVGDLERFCRFDGNGECCSVNCLGGCVNGVTSANCVACRNWTILESGVCTNPTEGCPSDKLELLNRFCVSREYCRKLESEPGKPYKIYGNKCLLMCPQDTNDDPDNLTNCLPCSQEECRRLRVANLTIMYMTDFPSPFTDLVGNLVINLEELPTSQTDVLKDKHLGSLRNVTGSLKVYRSERVQGLDLFESLEEIGSNGCTLSNGYCLTIHSNEFLQKLWRPKKGFLRIKNGNVSIAHNPRLCEDAIEEFKKYLDPSVHLHAEGNGDRGYCSSMRITPIKIRRQLREISHANIRETANTKWSVAVQVAFNLSNTDRLLTLSLYYRKPSPNKNLTFYDPAFCDDSITASEKWYRHVVNVNYSSPEYWIVEDGLKLFVTNISSPGLEPNSRYGIYALAQFMDGRIAMSNIFLFETIEAPSIWDYALQDFSKRVDKNASHNSLRVEWPRPQHPNGNITHYIVRYWETNSTAFNNEFHGCVDKQRLDYSRNPKQSDANDKPRSQYDAMGNMGHGGMASYSVDCGSYMESVNGDPNMLIASIFKKRPESPPDVNSDGFGDLRRRQALKGQPLSVHEVLGAESFEYSGQPLLRGPRSVGGDDFAALKQKAAMRKCEKTLELVKHRSQVHSTKNPDSKIEVVCKSKVSVFNLTHFTRYRFELRACFDPNPITDEYLCSERVYFTERTAAHPLADRMTADMVKESEYVWTENGRAHRQLTIAKPELVNGRILYFVLHYKPAGSTEQFREDCIDDDPNSQFIQYDLMVSDPKYEAMIRVETLRGPGNFSEIFYFTGVVTQIPTVMYIAIGTSAGLLLISAGLLAWYAFVLRKKRNQLTKDGVATPDWISMNPDYPLLTTIDIPDELELERDDIEVLAEIGRGSFGIVYRGLWQKSGAALSKGCPVAVKSLRCDATMRQKHEFLHEALILGALDCHHIIRLKGVVSRTQPIYVVMELMDNGDLKSFLVKHRPDNITVSSQNVAAALTVAPSSSSVKALPSPNAGVLTICDFTQMAGEVADGLAYLAAKKIVHRDLAARNCLVARDRTVKIGDFGLARDVYDDNYYHLHGRALLPIRWMAPESLRDGIFDTNSDVWSFGVLLWEIVTLGEQPYQGKSNEEVLEAVKQHQQVLNKPKNCPDKFYNMMLRCWQYKPTERPSFIDIVRELLPGLRPDFLKVSFYGSVLHEASNNTSSSTTMPSDSGVPHSIDHHSDDEDGSTAGPESPLLSVHSRDRADHDEMDDVIESLLAEDHSPSKANRMRLDDTDVLHGFSGYHAQDQPPSHPAV